VIIVSGCGAIDLSTVSGVETLSLTDGNGVETITLASATQLTSISGDATCQSIVFSSAVGSSTSVLSIDLGGSACDTIQLSNAGNNFVTLLGTEIMTGSCKADVISVGTGAGAITISGGLGTDTITGGCGADVIFGGNDADVIIGGLGADTISGGNGTDVLTGGDGWDVFVFNYNDSLFVTSLNDFDSITDFLGGGNDQISISSNANINLATGLTTGTVLDGDSFGSLINALNFAARLDGSSTGLLNQVKFGGNLYIVMDHSASSILTEQDLVIKLAGVTTGLTWTGGGTGTVVGTGP
jgi:serralysin